MGRSSKKRGGGGGGAAPGGDAYRAASLRTVLVLGDGDFSFSLGMMRDRAAHGAPVAGLVATSYDSRETVLAKYPEAAAAIKALRDGGAVVRHGVDATRLAETLGREVPGAAGGERFDRVVFNFPHTGMQRVHLNRGLMAGFFAAARPLADARAGEVHLSLKERLPYTAWNVREHAEDAGLVFVEKRPFCRYPEYRHQTTDPDAKQFAAENCVTHVFRRPDADADADARARKKERRERERAKNKAKKERAREERAAAGTDADAASAARGPEPAAWDLTAGDAIVLRAGSDAEGSGGDDDDAGVALENDKVLRKLRANALKVRAAKLAENEAKAGKEQYAQRKAIEKRDRRQKRRSEGAKAGAAAGAGAKGAAAAAAADGKGAAAPAAGPAYVCSVKACGRKFKNYPSARQHRRDRHPEMEPLKPEHVPGGAAASKRKGREGGAAGPRRKKARKAA